MTLAWLEIALIVLVLVSALITVVLRDALAAIIVFGAYSLGLAMLWVVFRTPDVGLTEAVVGAGVMTPLLLLAITKLGAEGGERLFVRIRWKPALAALGLVVLLLLTVPFLPAVGDPTSPANSYVSPYYLENAYDETGFVNVVTAILVAYRGFDTFGEVTVVFSALVAVLVVLHREVLA